MTRSASARTARPISRSSIWRRCAPFPAFTSTARRTRSRPPNAGHLALHRRDAPSLLALTRQSLPLLRHDSRLGKPLGARRLCAGRGGRRTPGHPARHRLGGFAGDGRARGAGEGRHPRRGGFDAVLGTLRKHPEGIPGRGARHRAARRRRGRGRIRLGPLARSRAAPSSA